MFAHVKTKNQLDVTQMFARKNNHINFTNYTNYKKMNVTNVIFQPVPQKKLKISKET